MVGPNVQAPKRNERMEAKTFRAQAHRERYGPVSDEMRALRRGKWVTWKGPGASREVGILLQVSPVDAMSYLVQPVTDQGFDRGTVQSLDRGAVQIARVRDIPKRRRQDFSDIALERLGYIA